MDIGKLLKNVHNLNEYITTTQDASEKCKNSKIQLNMSTVLALKKIRSLEIEYFNKCEENGIACIIFERMLCLPPSKTWSVLSKELVNLLQYWLDAIRKHLVRHNLQWWIFMKLLLRFVKEIRQKDSSLPDILVEHTAECLLDVATNSRPDAMQRHEILHCFNMYCSESSREIRFALRNKLGQYFTKLSTYMATCGHLPTQYSIMETLLRWLLPRQDRTLRITSAAKWFPSALYADRDVNIFLERPWMNFFQDARDFLNGHNQRHDLITSVVCRRLTVGKVVIISGTERQEPWLDINSVSRCVSVLLDPRVLDSFGATNHKSFETLVIAHDNTHSAKLHKQSLQLVLSVQTATPPRVFPSSISLGSDVSCDVEAVITTRCDVTRLDDALRKVFDEKYQVLFDIDKELKLSPLPAAEHSNHNKDSGEEARFSHPVEVKRRKHSGYIVKPRQHQSCMSPSTASTSSLAQLHEKLAALPRFKYDKEPVSVCAHPELSIVTEVSEADDRQSFNTTLQYKPYGVCNRNLNSLDISRKSESDPETSRKVRQSRRLSPVINEETTSCLLVATIGSVDDSVINDTVERLSKSKDYNPDNLVDLLVQEALQARPDDRDKSDDPNENSETIDNTPNIDEIKIKKVQKTTKVVSSTSDESNTEAIHEVPCYVNTRRKNKKDSASRNSFDEQVVEEFFTQHFTENKEGDIVISPTLAKKINETSSETSDNFGENFNLIAGDLEADIVPYDFNNIEVLECLNSMVDRVCNEFDKCTKYFNKDDEIATNPNEIQENIPLQDIMNTIQDIESKNKESTKPDAKKKIKLKYNIRTSKKAKTRSARRKNKLELEPMPKMSTIIEDACLESAPEDVENDVPIERIDLEKYAEKTKTDILPSDARESVTPTMRRKRKLYSPKDEQIAVDSPYVPEDDTVLSELIKLKKTPKSSATCYKEIEKDRQKHIRMPRTRKSKKPEPPSPRTKKMNDMFDKVKESTNGEKVTLADKTFEVDVYNFTSDSDDDFKVKKIEISKRNSTTTIGSVESAVSKRGRAVKRINYTDNKSSDESNKLKRKINRKPRTKKKVNIERNSLIDERMRKASDVLNTSMMVEKPKNTVNEPDLILEVAPEMEIIEEKGTKKSESNQKKTPKISTVEISYSKRPKRVLKKAVVEVVKHFDEDRTESPLPGLLVEPITINKEETSELTATMVDKFKKFYQEGPDTYINESNTTQNLLSDVERVNYSPPNVDITQEYIQIEDQLQSEDNKEKPKEKGSKKNKSNSIILKNTKKFRTASTKSIKKDKVEVINISEITDVKSEKSIATIGITGHGDFEEAPPSPKLINERLEPRNLEVEDLDHSMKDYFDKLTKEINDTNNRDSSGSNDEKVCKISTRAKNNNSVKSNSPIISIKRLSSEDISRWLPSRRNSESDEESYASAKSAMKRNSEESAVKIIKSPVKITESPEVSKSKPDDDISDISEITETKRQSLRLILNSGQSKNHNSDSESCNKSVKVKITRAKIIPKVVPAMKNVKSTDETATKVKPRQASVISPIKLFDELISNADKQSETSLSDDEEYMKEIVHTLANKKAETSRPTRAGLKSKNLDSTIPERKFLQKNVTKSVDSLSSCSKISTSTKIDTKMLKRRFEEDSQDCKKRKVEVNNNVECISGSGRTVSSVDDWFKRMDPECSRAETINVSMRHSMQNVLERLDTTLVEIHRNTSKKFVHLFVDAQKHLSELKEHRRSMYKQLASDILGEVVKIMDEKFADLDKRSQELDGDFMKQLKEHASELIREDCKQKRAMVRILKEDVQAVVDHMDRQGPAQ